MTSVFQPHELLNPGSLQMTAQDLSQVVDQRAVYQVLGINFLQVLGINSHMPQIASEIRSSGIQEGNNSHRSPSVPLHPQSGEDWLPFSPLCSRQPLCLDCNFFPLRHLANSSSSKPQFMSTTISSSSRYSTCKLLLKYLPFHGRVTYVQDFRGGVVW